MRRQLRIRLPLVAIAVLALGLVAVRFVRLEADPDTSLSRSRVFYTDEGYNSCNAVSKIVTGHWLCDRNNHLLLMPVMPVLQYVTFQVAGLSLTSARLPATVLSAVVIVLLLVLVQRRMQEEPRPSPQHRWLVLALALFLLGTNHYFFVYGRLALLDLPMTAFGLASLVLVHRALALMSDRRSLFCFAGAGVLLATALLTKPSAALYGTALSVLCLLQLLVEPRRWRGLLKGMLVTLVVAVTLVLVARALLGVAAAGYRELTPAHLVTDRIIFHLRTILRNYVKFFNNPVVRKNAPLLALAYLNVVLVAFNAARSGVFRVADRVVIALFVACYLFLGFFVHQLPRYFVVLVVPTSYLVATLPDNLRLLCPARRSVFCQGLFIGFALVANGWNMVHLGHYLWDPRYSMRTVAQEIRRTVEEDSPGGLLCGEVAATMALSNGMRFTFGVPQQGVGAYLLSQGEATVPGRDVVLLANFDLLNNYRCYDYGRRRMFLYRVEE